MLKKVEAYIKKWNMLSPSDTVIAGVSGGADSVCLFYLLKELSVEMGFALKAVHVNHKLRGEAADADEAYVGRICGEQGIALISYHIDVKELARKEKLSQEEAGRVARRRAFDDAVQRCGGTKIALAHHQDDNAETFLLHGARGSRLKGLGGIYPVNGMYIRPLLCVTREEIEGYLEKNGIDYCIDASNGEDTYTRNRIRNHVLPYFTEYINPRTVQHLNGAMEQLREIQGYMERQTEAAFTRCVEVHSQTEWFIDGARLEREDEVLRPMLLREAMVRLCGREKDIQEIHVQILAGLMERQTGRSVNLPYQMRALRTYGGILLCKEMPGSFCGSGDSEEQIIPLAAQKEGSLMFGQFRLYWRIFSISVSKQQIPKKTYTKWFDYDIIKHSIGVRTRRSGDRIVIDGRGGTQKLKSYFINEKIPAGIRDSIPLIAEGSEILWIAGYRQSKAYQVTDRTSTILEITINGGTCNGGDN